MLNATPVLQGLQYDEFFIMRKYKLKYYLQKICYSV